MTGLRKSSGAGKSPEMGHFGKFVQARRKKLLMTQQELARAVGLKTGQQVSNIERGATPGERFENSPRFKKLAEVLGLSVEALRRAQEPSEEPSTLSGWVEGLPPDVRKALTNGDPLVAVLSLIDQYWARQGLTAAERERHGAMLKQLIVTLGKQSSGPT